MQAKYAQAESLCEQSQAILEKVFGAEHPRVAGSLQHRASLLKCQV